MISATSCSVRNLYHRFTVSKLMTSAPANISDTTDGMEQVMQTFDDTKAWNLPVVDEEGRYTRDLFRNRRYLIHTDKYWYISLKIN